MKRRSKVSSKRAKGRPRNPAKRKPRTAHKEQSHETGMAWLTRELDEAREQQRATSELLRVISQASFQLQSVLQRVAETAARLCRADGTVIFQLEDGLYRFAAGSPAFAEERRRSPYRPHPASPVGHMLRSKTPMHVRDVMAEEAYATRRDSGAVAAVELGGARTVLSVPLLNKGDVIGAFFLCRQQVRSFTEKQIELVQNFAAQAALKTPGYYPIFASALPTSPTRWSSKRQYPSSCKYSAALRTILNRFFRPYSRVPSAFARQISAICSSSRTAPFARLQCLTLRKRIQSFEHAHHFLDLPIAVSAAWRQRRMSYRLLIL